VNPWIPLLISLIIFGITLVVIIGLIIRAVRRHRTAVNQVRLKIAELEGEIARLKNRKD